jgi:hypothetical protein
MKTMLEIALSDIRKNPGNNSLDWLELLHNDNDIIAISNGSGKRYFVFQTAAERNTDKIPRDDTIENVYIISENGEKQLAFRKKGILYDPDYYGMDAEELRKMLSVKREDVIPNV